MMKRSSNWCGLALAAVILLALAGTCLGSQGQTQNQAPRPARSRTDETSDMWNEIGNKLVAMARDFPKTSTPSSCRRTSAPSLRTRSEYIQFDESKTVIKAVP